MASPNKGPTPSSKPVTPLGKNETILMTGSLWKAHTKRNLKGEIAKYMKTRHHRFCVLFGPENPKLCYWRKEKSYREKEAPHKIYDLEGCSISGNCDRKTGTKNTIGIFHPSRRVVYMSCPDAHQFGMWLEAMEGVLVNTIELSFSHFDLLCLVGKGAFGQVFQVKMKDTDQIYALKVLDKGHLKSKAQVQSTKTERMLLEVVQHPFIVRLHYAFQTDSELCFVMDFINGGELFQHLKEHGKFPENSARLWAAEILLALEYLHSMGIIYRDLKPENVLIDSVGHVKITDFGLARNMSDEEGSQSLAGSPYYMAPEVILMKGHDTQCDWWSLGILVYEMLVGLPPFYSASAKEGYQKLLTQPIEYPSHVSMDARVMIDGLLETNPKKRLGAKTSSKKKKEEVDEEEEWGDGHCIKEQKWFSKMDWDKVLLKKYRPGFIPKVKDQLDVSLFDEVFTKDTSWKEAQFMKRRSAFVPTQDDEFGEDFHFDGRAQQTGTQNRKKSSPEDFRFSALPSAVKDMYLSGHHTHDPTICPWALRAKAPGGSSMKQLYRETSSLSETTFDLPIALTGHLHKEGKYMKSWQRRFVMIVPSLGALLYYKAQEDSCPSGAVPIPDRTNIQSNQGIIWSLGQAHIYSFVIKTEGRELQFLCSSEEERENWVRALKSVGNRWSQSLAKEMQVVAIVKNKSSAKTGIFRQRRKSSQDHEVINKGSWTAQLANGKEIEMISEVAKLDDGGTVRYDTQAMNDMRHGRGIQLLDSTSSDILYYDGNWVFGDVAGKGMIRYKDGGFYEGEVLAKGSRAIRSGKGKMRFANRDLYEGEWAQDHQDGQGMMYWTSSSELHKGTFRKGMAEGQGTRTSRDGRVYSGGWHNGEKFGLGVIHGIDDDDNAAHGLLRRSTSLRCIDGMVLGDTDDEPDVDGTEHADTTRLGSAEDREDPDVKTEFSDDSSTDDEVDASARDANWRGTGCQLGSYVGKAFHHRHRGSAHEFDRRGSDTESLPAGRTSQEFGSEFGSFQSDFGSLEKQSPESSQQ